MGQELKRGHSEEKKKKKKKHHLLMCQEAFPWVSAKRQGQGHVCAPPASN